MDSTVERFATLFAGNDDYYYTDETRCTPTYTLTKPTYPQFALSAMYRDHLEGRLDIGIYPMWPEHIDHEDGYETEWWCCWGCVDIDVDDLDMAVRLQRALEYQGVASWIEVSRSKGYHVWVFAAENVPAITMRHALLAACAASDCDSKEVNPKSDGSNLKPESPGNCVRLPYPGALGSVPIDTKRRRMVDTKNWHSFLLPAFLDAAEAALVSRHTLERVASYYKPPAKPVHTFKGEAPSGALEELLAKAGPLVRVIHNDGPLPDPAPGRVDRSSGLFRLAKKCSLAYLTRDEAMVILQSADARWGKFFDRADGEDRLWDIITDAYGSNP